MKTVPCELLKEPTGVRLAIVGESPGNTEAQVGRPFVGMSGKLLRTACHQLGIDLECSLITNVENRVSETAKKHIDIAANLGRLKSELETFRPDRILALGADAAHAMMGEVSPISSVRGRWYTDQHVGVPVLPCYHPAFILRNPTAFRDFEHDLELFAAGNVRSNELVLPKKVIITPSSRVEKAFAFLDPNIAWALDIETTGLNPQTDDVIAMGITDGNVVFIFLREAIEANLTFLRHKMFQARWILHNGEFDWRFLKTKYNICFGFHADTMLLQYILDERKGTHDLDTVAGNYLGIAPYKRAFRQVHGRSFGEAPIEALCEYLAKDVTATFRLYPVLMGEATNAQKKLFWNRIMLATKALARVQLYGVRIDQSALNSLALTWEAKTEALVSEIREELEEPELNIFSPKQLAALLYDEMELRPIARHGRTTQAKVLEALAQKYKVPVLQKIIEARQYKHMRSTYALGLQSRLDPDRRLRTDFLLHGTETGRLSSQNPNFQNIPKIAGTAVRDAFISDPGWVLVEADYSQLELRVAAHFSQDKVLIDAFKKGLDIHAATAARMYRVPLKEVTQEQRHYAKMLNFGVIYGRGPVSIAEQLSIPVQEAKDFLESYYGNMQGLHKWIEAREVEALEVGYVTSAFGRQRRFPLVLPEVVHIIQNQARNMPIQSTASDVCLGALVRLESLYTTDGYGMRILLTVHDSILFQVREDVLDERIALIRKIMENVPKEVEDIFPYPVDIKIGKRWGSLKEYQK